MTLYDFYLICLVIFLEGVCRLAGVVAPPILHHRSFSLSRPQSQPTQYCTYGYWRRNFVVARPGLLPKPANPPKENRSKQVLIGGSARTRRSTIHDCPSSPRRWHLQQRLQIEPLPTSYSSAIPGNPGSARAAEKVVVTHL